ncbi:hypothetical protein DVH24_005063 [Malus domestica]|uniref:RNase H type-1 domain-containing protein n=1 Tax=Malus domestica TaxID=3750 RepID=A0A498IDP5_MALDO|nr:hypothetical protein DVH24_005063 [Malus domestica]
MHHIDEFGSGVYILFILFIAWLQEFRKWHGSKQGSRRITPQKWEKPGVGWVKCNFDGAWDEVGELGGVGVMLQLCIFRGVSSAVLAEIMVAWAAILFARNLGVMQLKCRGMQ